MKRVFSYLLIFALLLSCCPIIPLQANAATVVASGTCGADVRWELDADGVLTISGTGPMDDYPTASNAPWYSQRASVTKIVIGDNITTIGDRAFYSCEALKTLLIGAKVQAIGVYAFRGCKSLTELTIPASVTELKASAFRSCEGLKKVIVKGNAPSCGNYVFNECGNFYVVWHEGTTGFDVSPWKEYVMPDGEMVIPQHVGEWIVDVEATCTTDGSMHIECTYCQKSYTEIIPAAHEYVDGVCIVCREVELVALGTCGSNLNWTLDGLGTLTVSGTGSMRNYNGYVSPWEENKDQIKKLIVEYGVSSIGECAFQQCTNLESIMLPGSVRVIHMYAFENCPKLEDVSLSAGLQKIGYAAFSHCSSLKRIEIPEGVTVIGGCAFDFCVSLESVEIPESVTIIDGGAFGYCKSLASISIPESVKTLGPGAFSYCEMLTEVVIPEGLDIIDYDTFHGCINLVSVTIPESVSRIGGQAFHGCSNLRSIVIPESVTTIDWNAFAFSGLVSVAIPESIDIIPYGMFMGCNYLTSVVIPDGVTVIDGGAFYDCSQLMTITIPASVESILGGAFDGCTKLENVYYKGTLAQWDLIEIDAWPNDGLIGANVNLIITEGVAEDSLGNRYTSLTKAIKEADDLRLLCNTSEAVEVSRSVTLDLNGFTVSGAVAIGNGCTLAVKDSQTDDYTIEDECGYGKLLEVTGNVVAADGYLKITEDNGISFHRVGLELTSVTLRPEKVGIYYNGAFFGDEVVAENVDRFGVALRLDDLPDENYMEATSAYSWYKGFAAGANGNVANGTLLKNIMKQTCTTAENRERSQNVIYGRAYLLTKDGQYIFGESCGYSLMQVLQKVDAQWANLNQGQKDAVKALYERFEDVVGNWHLPNINDKDIDIPI